VIVSLLSLFMYGNYKTGFLVLPRKSDAKKFCNL
jgi:hypothetical protein